MSEDKRTVHEEALRGALLIGFGAMAILVTLPVLYLVLMAIRD